MAVDDSDHKINRRVLALQLELDRVLGLPPHKRLAAFRAKYKKTKQPIWQVLAANFDVLEYVTPAPFSINRRPPRSFSERVAQEKAKRKEAQATLLEARAKLITMLGENMVKKKLTSPAGPSSLDNGGCTEVLERQKFRRYFAVRSRQLSPSHKEASFIRSRRPGGWRLWCSDNNGFFCKRREAMIKSWEHYFNYTVIQYAYFCPSLWEYVDEAEERNEEDEEDSDGENDEDPDEEGYAEDTEEEDTDGLEDEYSHDDDSDDDYDSDSEDDSEIGLVEIDNCTKMVQQQLIHQGKFQEAERLKIQKHDLDIEDYICLLSTVVTDTATQMSTFIQKAMTSTDHIKRELQERHWKYNDLRRHRGTDCGPYRGLAYGRPSPLRDVTNAEDLKDDSSETKAGKKTPEKLWRDEDEEEARREFVATWDEDDAGLEW
ncbi:hypothetical protein M434DRAFT_18691 [Hypoxylon sp. CO27-5]|nr:hypothetical protein M434DRAFT_18691 [Hypoxylon sp. CO27-5]